MKIRNWRPLFDGTRLARGEDYFLSGCVTLIDVCAERITAEVDGSELYSVEIELENGEVGAMDCTCPYAQDGFSCKHMAAALFAAEEAEPMPERKAVKFDLEKAVSELPEDTARALLLDAARKYGYLENRIYYIGKTKVEPSAKREWERELKRITRSFGGDCGYIDYNDAFDYTEALDAYLSETIEPLIENGLIRDAIDLTELVFNEVRGIDIDDSDGNTATLFYSLHEYWRRLIAAPGCDQRYLFDRLKKMMDADCLYLDRDDIIRFAIENIDAPELQSEIAVLLDECIEAANIYELERLVPLRAEVMRKCGVDEVAICAFLDKYSHLNSVFNMRLNRLKNEEKWSAAIKMLQDRIKQDAGSSFYARERSEELIEFLGEHGSCAEHIAALKEHLLKFRQYDTRYAARLHTALSAEEWAAVYPKLIDADTLSSIKIDLLLMNGSVNEAIAALEKDPQLIKVEKYERRLFTLSPEKTRALIETAFEYSMQCANCRDHYAAIISKLSLLNKYDGGRQTIEKLIEGWKQKYRRRTAMLDELKKSAAHLSARP